MRILPAASLRAGKSATPRQNLAHRLGLDDANSASRVRPGRHERHVETELRALLEAAPLLGGWAQAAGETDLPEGGGLRTGGRAARRRGDRQRDREIRSGLVDPHSTGDVDEDIGLPER
jgi:hypothetical protein